MNRYLCACVVHITVVALILQLLYILFPGVSGCYLELLGKCITFLLFSMCTFRFTKFFYLKDEVKPDNKAVLVTGCDTGFGHQLAKKLEQKGFYVFACCLFPEGEGAAKLLKTSSVRLRVIGMDVTKDESIKKAVQIVKDNLGSNKLWAVVNNAGILKGFSVEFSTIEDFKSTMEVNVFGQVRVTKAFAPLLRKSKGRVVNVTSLAGRMGFVHCMPYFMSKFASVGFNECLRLELSAWDISVVSIEPELFQTQLTNRETVEKLLKNSFESTEEDILQDYGDDYYGELKKKLHTVLDFASSRTEVVVNDMVTAVTLLQPDITYKPRRNSLFRWILFVHENMPSIVQDFFIKKLFGISRIGNLD